MEFTFKTTQTVLVKYLKASCDVRYWEDAKVDGVVDEDGSRIPLRIKDMWQIFVDLETGIIVDWPEGVTADIHYKVCDAGVYCLVNDNGEEYAEREWYVPSMLSPSGDGYGDYVIMKVGGSGKIEDWKADLDFFNEDEE